MSETATYPSLSAHPAWMEQTKSPFEMAAAELLVHAAEYRRVSVNALAPEDAALIRIAERYEAMAAARRTEYANPNP